MRPEQPLTIYEIRARDQEALGLFDQGDNLGRLGPALAGLHWEADFAFLFFTGEAGPEVDEFLREHPQLEPRHIHHLTYAQWQDGAGAAPFTVAGLTIAGPDDGSVAAGPRLVIDPGLAFGFGGHPTTRCCLEFLARACQVPKGPFAAVASSRPGRRGRDEVSTASPPPRSGPPASALDLGAGTGILSLAAARWGVERVVGVDYSHLAVEAARNNLRLNGLEDQVRFFRAPAQDFAAHPAEILLANLHLALQEELLELGAFAHRRRVIVSGLLPSEGDRLLERLRAVGLKLLDQERTDRWITMFLGREDEGGL